MRADKKADYGTVAKVMGSCPARASSGWRWSLKWSRDPRRVNLKVTRHWRRRLPCTSRDRVGLVSLSTRAFDRFGRILAVDIISATSSPSHRRHEDRQEGKTQTLVRSRRSKTSR